MRRVDWFHSDNELDENCACGLREGPTVNRGKSHSSIYKSMVQCWCLYNRDVCSGKRSIISISCISVSVAPIVSFNSIKLFRPGCILSYFNKFIPPKTKKNVRNDAFHRIFFLRRHNYYRNSVKS